MSATTRLLRAAAPHLHLVRPDPPPPTPQQLALAELPEAASTMFHHMCRVISVLDRAGRIDDSTLLRGCHTEMSRALLRAIREVRPR